MRRLIFCILFVLAYSGYTFAQDPLSVAYVCTAGSDTDHDGSVGKPFRTIRKALQSTSENATIIIRGGDYRQVIDLGASPPKRSLHLMALPGERVRLLCGEAVERAESVSGYGNVLKTQVGSFPDSPHYRIYQHDVPDESTRIDPAERHPLQRGKIHRCNSTPLVRVGSASEVAQSAVAAYYYDAEAKTLYFSCVKGYPLSAHPVYLPTSRGVYGGNNRIALRMTGIEVLYAGFNLTGCSGASVVDCAAKYAYAGGGFVYNMCVGIEFVRCEAARTVSSSGNGDGFNGHSRITDQTHPEAKHTTVTLTDCWAHDNYDDGYSNHERCEGVVYGGLFEYNVKYGLGSGYGAHESFYNVVSRKNQRYGFAVCADIYDGEGGYASQIALHHCIAQENGMSGYLAYTSANTKAMPNSMQLFNCMSVGNGIGYEVRDSTRMILTNCGDLDSATPYTGNPVIRNIPVLGTTKTNHVQ